MSDLSEQQVMMADAAAGFKAQMKRARRNTGPGYWWNACWRRFLRTTVFFLTLKEVEGSFV